MQPPPIHRDRNDLYAPIQFGDDCTHGKGKLMRLLAAVHASKHCQLQ